MKINNPYFFNILTIFIYAIVLFFYYDESQKTLFFIFIPLVLILVFTLLTLTTKNHLPKQFKTAIDVLDEIIIVKSNNKIYAVNNSFLKFFDMKSFKEFNQKYNCISDTFIKENGFIDVNFCGNIDKLMGKINATEKSKRLVQIPNKEGKPHTLRIRIDKLEKNKNFHVIVLSDITKLQNEVEKFEKKANTDELTGAYSRQKFNTICQSEFSRSIRYFNPLTILFIDIDNFKAVNDTHGHDIGDNILKEFAKTISTNIREFDVFARWGGEEFILLLPQTNINSGYKLAEKLRNSIMTTTFEKVNTLTCSIGISTLIKGDGIDDLIKRADNALYKAKNNGRNRTIIEI